MGTRSGDIVRPSFYISNKYSISCEEFTGYSEQKSACWEFGCCQRLQGLSAARKGGSRRAALALSMLEYQSKSMWAPTPRPWAGLDALAFTGARVNGRASAACLQRHGISR
jgi:acetate kinase